MSDVNCGYVGGSSTKQHVGKASGGCSRVQATLALHLDIGERVEGTGELVPCAADVFGQLALAHVEGILRAHKHGRFARNLAVDLHVSCRDEFCGEGSGAHESGFDQVFIEAHGVLVFFLSSSGDGLSSAPSEHCSSEGAPPRTRRGFRGPSPTARSSFRGA